LHAMTSQALLFGYRIDLLDQAQAVHKAWQFVGSSESCQVVTLNPEMIMQGEDNPELAQVLKTAELALPDGAGLVWALRHRGHPVNRLPGIEFSESLLAKASAEHHAVAFIGAKPEILNLAVENLKTRFPALQFSYTHHGYFKADEEETIARACAATQPTIVLVALGVPRQEFWIAKYRSLFPGAILVGVGGSLDVWSGQIQRAPALMRRLNLEWLYRISSQPFGKQGRVKRTYKTLPMFVVKVLLSRDAS
jgi:N-acetylglucosaminyldiphosphoundecaprenol N-acetyl-beta-D-mannosaminyltransferase